MYISPTGLLPSLDPLSIGFDYITSNTSEFLGTLRSVRNTNLCDSPSSSPIPAVKLASNSVYRFTQKGLGSSAFARHYSRNQIPLLISANVMFPQKLERDITFSLFLWVLRCFTSPGASRYAYVFSVGYRDFIAMGCPIRKFPDHRLLATSPRLIAGCYVLHQLLATKPSTVRPYVLRPSNAPTVL